MEKYKVGIIGATGMVGQRFLTLWQNIPGLRLRPWRPAAVLPASLTMKR